MLHPDLTLPTPTEIAQLSPEALAQRFNALSGTLGQKLGLEFTSLSPERVLARMPVEGNRQPIGRLHGGANLALAEEMASLGSWLNLDPARQGAVGVDLSGTHVRGVTEGLVSAEAIRVHKGRRILVWTVDIRDEAGRLTSLARCTCQVVDFTP